MSQETPPISDESSSTPPPPPPTGGHVGPRLLRRSRTDRVISGVAGGIGNYFGIDPVIVRILFVVLAVAGGSGVPLYLIAWLVIAKEGQDETRAVRSLRGSTRDGRGLLTVLLLVAGVLILTSGMVWWPFFGIGDGLAVPLLLVAAGVALLVWPDNGGDWHRPWRADDEAHSGATPAMPMPPVPPEPGTDLVIPGESAVTTTQLIGDVPPPPDPDATPLSPPQWSHGYRRGHRRHANGNGGPPHHRRERPDREQPFVGPLTLALMLLFTGGAVLAHRMDWVVVDLAIFLGILLAIVGGGLVLSAFLGRARGLILLGIMLLPVAWAVNTVDLTWWDGVGEESVEIDSIRSLEDEYRFGIGEFHIDMTELDFSGEDRNVAVGLTIGEAIVFVPDNVHVIVDLDARIGEIRVVGSDGEFVDEGVHPSLNAEVGEDGSVGTLELDFDLGIGAARVVVCGADPGVLSECP